MKKYFRVLYKEINNWKIREKKEENKGYSRITNIQKEGVSETNGFSQKVDSSWLFAKLSIWKSYVSFWHDGNKSLQTVESIICSKNKSTVGGVLIPCLVNTN